MVGGMGFGLPEVFILVMLLFFGILPWVAAIWALVTLWRMRGTMDAMRLSLERIEQHLQRR
jgi:hypothetical protein